MCMSKMTANPPTVYDVSVVKDFYTEEDIVIPGDLYIIGGVSFYAENVEVGGSIYIISDGSEEPYVDATALKAHGEIISDCFDNVVSPIIIALEGCSLSSTNNWLIGKQKGRYLRPFYFVNYYIL